jgi:hypothetical protein
MVDLPDFVGFFGRKPPVLLLSPLVDSSCDPSQVQNSPDRRVTDAQKALQRFRYLSKAQAKKLSEEDHSPDELLKNDRSPWQALSSGLSVEQAGVSFPLESSLPAIEGRSRYPSAFAEARNS